VTYSVSCASTTDTNGSATITWTTKGTNEVWILESSTASSLVGADAKTEGGHGPLPANGSKSLAFACNEMYDYYLVEGYNTSDGTHSGIIEQVPYS
jgi:hypothetical protein